MLRHVVVPEGLDLAITVPLPLPLAGHRPVNQVDRLDQKGPGAGSGVKDLDEGLVGRSAFGDRYRLAPRRHLAPRRRVRETVFEPELATQELVHRAHDVRDDRSWRVEHPPAHLLALVVRGQEVLVKVDDRVFLRVPVAEIAEYGLHVRVVQELDYLGGAQLVEVDACGARFRVSSRAEEGFHQVAQEGVGAHVRREAVGRLAVRVGDARREQAVRNGLGVHVRESVRVQVVQKRGLECLHESGKRAGRRLDLQNRFRAVADRAGQLRQTHGQRLGRGDHLPVAEPERPAPLLAPDLGIVLVIGPGEVVGQLPGHVVQVKRRVEVVPAQDLQSRQVACRLRLGEMGERDPPLVALAVVRDEEQVVRGPARALGVVRRRAFRDRYASEDSAERHDRQPFRLELDEEDAPRLARRQRGAGA